MPSDALTRLHNNNAPTPTATDRHTHARARAHTHAQPHTQILRPIATTTEWTRETRIVGGIDLDIPGTGYPRLSRLFVPLLALIRTLARGYSYPCSRVFVPLLAGSGTRPDLCHRFVCAPQPSRRLWRKWAAASTSRAAWRAPASAFANGQSRRRWMSRSGVVERRTRARRGYVAHDQCRVRSLCTALCTAAWHERGQHFI